MIARERLAAYVDGALEPEEAAAVVMHLADHEDDQAYVDRLGTLNRALAAAYSAPLEEPTPERFRATILGRRRPMPVPGRPMLGGLALAAALAAGIVLLLMRGGAGDGDLLAVGPVAPDTPLHAALEEMASGQSVEFGARGSLTMIGTFRSVSRGFCREVEAMDGEQDQFTRAIACRGNGRWDVAVSVSEPVRGPEADGGYQPAGGTSGAALGAALDALEAGSSLARDEEERLIEAGWSG